MPVGETCHDLGVDAAVWISVVAASVTVASLPFTVRAANSARLSVPVFVKVDEASGS